MISSAPGGSSFRRAWISHSSCEEPYKRESTIRLASTSVNSPAPNPVGERLAVEPRARPNPTHLLTLLQPLSPFSEASAPSPGAKVGLPHEPGRTCLLRAEDNHPRWLPGTRMTVLPPIAGILGVLSLTLFLQPPLGVYHRPPPLPTDGSACPRRRPRRTPRARSSRCAPSAGHTPPRPSPPGP